MIAPSAGGRDPERPDRSVRPPPGPVPSLRLPTFERFHTTSGLDVWVAQRHDVPEASLRWVLEGGAVAEPESASGLAELTGRLLSEGAGSCDAMGVARWLDRLGASFHVEVSYDVVTLSLHCLSDVTAEALDFLATVVRAPRFETPEVERIRTERLDEIAREQDEPAIVADHLLIGAIYGSHVYGRPAGGSADSVATLDRDAVVSFHRDHYGARKTGLVVCGSVDPQTLERELEAGLGDWAACGDRPEAEAPPSHPISAGQVILGDRPDSPQAEIRVGTIGAPYGTPDHHAALLANAILGGLFNSRINMNLREDKGWTYGARSTFRFRRRAGPFVVRTAVETQFTAAAVEEVLGELAGLRDRPPTEEEINLAKNAMTLSLPLQFETNGQVSRKVARQMAYELPDDYWIRFRSQIEAVTRDDIVAVAERYFRREDLVIVAVTDGSVVRDDLAAVGHLTFG